MKMKNKQAEQEAQRKAQKEGMKAAKERRANSLVLYQNAFGFTLLFKTNVTYFLTRIFTRINELALIVDK